VVYARENPGTKRAGTSPMLQYSTRQTTLPAIPRRGDLHVSKIYCKSNEKTYHCNERNPRKIINPGAGFAGVHGMFSLFRNQNGPERHEHPLTPDDDFAILKHLNVLFQLCQFRFHLFLSPHFADGIQLHHVAHFLILCIDSIPL